MITAKDIGGWIFVGIVRRKVLQEFADGALAKEDYNVKLNDVEKAISEEMACGHLTTRDIATAIKVADELLYGFNHNFLPWTKLEFIEALDKILDEKWDIAPKIYDSSCGCTLPNPEFWHTVKSVEVGTNGLRITAEEYDGLTSHEIGKRPWTELKKETKDESAFLTFCRFLTTIS